MNPPIRAIVFDPEQRHWLHFSSPRRVYAARHSSEVISALKEVEQSCSHDNLWAVGWISYEAASAFDPALQTHAGTSFPKVWFATFGEPEITQELPVTVAPPLLSWTPSVSSHEYQRAVQSIRQAIARGDTYQANYSFRLVANEAPEALPLFSAMARSQGGDYHFLVETGDYSIASASPELFFKKNGASIVSRPMKGTAPRGLTLAHDIEIAKSLRSSSKDRAENIMIVDMTRNDLSRVATRGSVSVPSSCVIEKYPHMFQMTSEVVANTNASLVEIITALFPAASITGAPKTETMRIIADRESSPRNIYTGSLGVISPHDRAWFNVAIRTALIDHAKNRTEYGIGSGIVWDSQTEREYDECVAKAAAVTRATPPFELFETLLWEQDTGFFLLDEHLNRLEDGASYLSWPFSRESATQALEETAREGSSTKEPRRVRLFLSKFGTTRAEITSVPQLPSPYRLSLARYPISTSDLSLYRKTTNRDSYDRAMPQSPGAHDVLLWNERGEITETKIANICLEIDGTLYTPPVSSGLLNGCYRNYLLKNGEIVERVLLIEDLARASRLVLMNSLRRTWEGQLLERVEDLAMNGSVWGHAAGERHRHDSSL